MPSMETENDKKDQSEPPLVLIIEDFEAFPANILKELISIIRCIRLVFE